MSPVAAVDSTPPVDISAAVVVVSDGHISGSSRRRNRSVGRRDGRHRRGSFRCWRGRETSEESRSERRRSLGHDRDRFLAQCDHNLRKLENTAHNYRYDYDNYNLRFIKFKLASMITVQSSNR